MDTMEECQFEMEQHLKSNGVDIAQFSDEVVGDFVYKYYKNYYYYDMDEEYAARAAVSETLKERGLFIDSYEMWLP